MRRLGKALTSVVLLAPAVVMVGPADPATAGATCQGVPVTITGTDGPDVLDGTPGDDVISGGAGADVIRGLGGNDVLCGDGDDDKVSGGPGSDVVVGGADRRGDEWGESHFYYYGDLLIGGLGDDTFVGDEPGGTDPDPYGADTVSYEDSTHAIRLRMDRGIVAGQGHDTFEDVTSVVLSAHDDRAVAGGDIAQIEGGPGDDWVTSGVGFSPPYRDDLDALIDGYLDGGLGDDEVTSGAPGWRLLGGGGGDLLVAGDRATMAGGAGSDRVIGSSQADVVSIVGRDHVGTAEGADRVTVGARVHDDEPVPIRLNTGAGDDVVRFSTKPADGTVIRLSGGSDRTVFEPYAFESEDAPMPDVKINAGAGRDLFGSPFLITDGTPGPIAGEVADLAAGTVRTRGTTSVMTIHNFEDLKGTPWRDVLLGTDGPNTIRGGERADTIRGRGGVDHADGGAGRDRCEAEITRGCEDSLS